jgi:glycosyltransferase involved in cell wall biosynthesis
MKILYIITQADGGGAQKYTLALASHFGGTIAAGNEATKLFSDAAALGINTIELKHLKRSINPFHDFLAIWEIRQLINYLEPDIVHLNSSKAGILGSFAAIGLKKKVVFTAHGFVFNEPLPVATQAFYLALEKTASSYRNFIITVSESDRKSAMNNNLIKADKIQTVYNGIPQIGFLYKQQAREALNLPQDNIIIGNTSSFYKTKGLDVLIDAIALLDKSLNVEFAILGKGKLQQELERQISQLGLEAKIKLITNLNRADVYLKAFDLFIMPSRKEGFPFALLEAMQAGLPIIATEVGGITECLGDAAVLVPAENPGELANAITVLVNDQTKRNQLSQKALERAGMFTETKMLEETEKIYRKLILSK